MSKLIAGVAIILMVLAGAYYIEYVVTLPSDTQENQETERQAENIPRATAELNPAPATATPESSENTSNDTQEPQTSNQIILESPQPETTVSSPLVISGQARGPWYFEGSFPAVLTDWDGLIIAEGRAQAQGEWTTEAFVPFTAELTFDTPTQNNRGSLILQKANPSGRPENDDALEITVFFEN